MNKPKNLKIGDTIGLISPASPENIDSIKSGIEFLKNLGFNIKEGAHLYDRLGYLAGNDINRASDLITMFQDPDVDMILCVRGGYGTMRILPLLDYDIIKANPKIFMGFSDITTLLNELALKCDLITFHGPMGSSNLKDNETLNSFLSTLSEEKDSYKLNNPNGIKLMCEVEGIVEGQLVGGNLCLICSTLGTPYEIDTKDKILFIEEVGEPPYRIDRMLTQLLLSNKLQQCKGFILGQFTDCTLPYYEKSLTLEEVLYDRLLSLNKPTLSGFMSGHSYPKLTVPIGAKVKLDCFKGAIEILESVVS